MKIAVTIGTCLVVLLGCLLAWHIHSMRPHIDARTRVMARIDLHQRIDRADADRITAWLMRQRGVEHALVNPQAAIAVFTFAPVKNDADRIVRELKASLPYRRAERYLPSKEQLASGCPVMR